MDPVTLPFPPLWLLSAVPRDPSELERDAPDPLRSEGQVAETVTALITGVDLVGVFFFAISGAVLAVRKGYDVVGSLLLALMVGTGGGVIRDLIIGQDVPAAFRNPWYLILPALGSLAVFVKLFDGERGRHAVMAFDAIGLAVYCVVGTRIALIGGLEPVSAAVLGVVTAVGGGILRDVVAGEPPAVFGGRGWYAVPAIIGSAATASLGAMGLLSIATMAGTMALVLTLRVVSMRGDWLAPGAEITGETQRQRIDPDDAPPVPDVRDRPDEDGGLGSSGEEDPTDPPRQVEESAVDRVLDGGDARPDAQGGR
ncbi:trimeric intracellular cation channel family protein [Micrococcus sp. M4NT]|uniref:trimeric intracellular cation channel family protein n=1 Tax=Micrococcus sp. M4NT TaxID=2957501 RepID=UPI0029A18758|nr:trimeric intracellular cation channel family protein [Micrococcus sp. M4NT]MDX2340556.1 trimeric intracellular cation channel family protein [Micrococcus sp. M4NT]